MRYCSLMSGSSGNCHYIEGSQGALMVDAGQSGKRILANAQTALGRPLERLTAILVTHAHRDHVLGVGVLARRFQVPVYATEGTWFEMGPLIGEIPVPLRRVIDLKESFKIGLFEIEAFPTSHDALESVGYILRENGRSLGIATDSGVFSSHMGRRLQDIEGLILESNHDLEMLRKGPYPMHLKRRIASAQGHLSNEDALRALEKIVGPKTRHVVLAHLSEENNRPRLVYEGASAFLETKNIQLQVAPRCLPGKWVDL